MTITEAKRRAESNLLKFGGEWRVVRYGHKLYIQMTISELPSEDAEVIYIATSNPSTTCH